MYVRGVTYSGMTFIPASLKPVNWFKALLQETHGQSPKNLTLLYTTKKSKTTKKLPSGEMIFNCLAEVWKLPYFLQLSAWIIEVRSVCVAGKVHLFP
jgi:hypothetical protein